jgi:1,4-dihydroxy-2-naphthoate octaprenyltransferase
MKPTRSELQTFLIRIANPLQILFIILFSMLGAGIADFLGHTIHWVSLLLGAGTIIMLQLGSFYLDVFFDLNDLSAPPDKKYFVAASDRQFFRLISLQAAVVSLAVGAILTVVLAVSGGIGFSGYAILGTLFGLAYFYAIPPVRFSQRGYGELAQAVFTACLVSAFAFVLQTSSLHRMIGMLTFPLVLVFIAMQIALSFQSYANEMALGPHSLLGRMGWQNGMNVHNLLILSAYLLIGVFSLLGLAWSLTWPAMLAFPVGLFQIWQIIRIKNGERPNWKLLNFTAVTHTLLMAYLIAFSLWTH